ncbi:hypothetical protein ACI1MP_03395 [Kitasatospora griseola]|uniref:hypothetical protein n=1 Tax=Kitasatospora griseola TaxID=2064 RepID=UPI0038556D2A
MAVQYGVTVDAIDDELQVVSIADRWLRHLRFARSRAESTTKAHADGVALYPGLRTGVASVAFVATAGIGRRTQRY